MYIRYINGKYIKEDLLFCKQITGRATAEEMFKIIDIYFWSEMEGLCRDLYRWGSGYGWEMWWAASTREVYLS